MKKIAKELLPVIFKSKALTLVLQAIMHLTKRKNVADRLSKLQAENDFFKSINYNKTVISGPFKGMEYPSLVSNCSDMAPKIIGSYEAELHGLIEKLCNDTSYKKAVDIGCAEGYYAVGLLKRLAQIEMYAYDIDQMSRQFCLKMAKDNEVDDRLTMGEFCTSETLKNFPFVEKSLILSDCEGYEIELFTKESIPYLKNCDILIELHDLFNPLITPTLLPLFESTHHIQLIKSEPRDSTPYPQLGTFGKPKADLIVSESREGEMQWVFLTSKLHSN